MKAIQIEAFGNPAEVLKVVDIPDVGSPGEGEVVIALEASPINMSDLLMISGRYGYRPKLPSIVGAEGVGRMVAVGGGVTASETRRPDAGAVSFRRLGGADQGGCERLAATCRRRRPAACDARHQSGDRLSDSHRFRHPVIGSMGDSKQRQFRRRARVDRQSQNRLG